MKLDFLIEPAKFRHCGQLKLVSQVSNTQTIPSRSYTEKKSDSIKIFFSQKEASGLMAQGEELAIDFSDQAPDKTSQETIVFRYSKKLADWWYGRKGAVRLIYENRQYQVQKIIDFNGLKIYHLAVIFLSLNKEF